MELELKLVALEDESLSEERVLAALEALAIPPSPSRTMQLLARYHDSADGLLRSRRWVLRSRSEAPGIVAAVKGPGPLIDGLRARLEIEAALADWPEAGDPLPESLRAPLEHAGITVDSWPPELFRTEVERFVLRFRVGGTEIEAALDRGAVLAAGHRAPVRELELELIHGPAQALLHTALELAKHLDVRPGGRSKSGRGLQLLGLLDPPVLPPPQAAQAELWEALCELEEWRREGVSRWRGELLDAARRLGISCTPEDEGWNTELWSALARVSGGG